MFLFILIDRLWKLDKISAGDHELVGENINIEGEVTSFKSIDLNVKEINLPNQAKVGTVTFTEINCIQPFRVRVSSNVLLLIDFHSHLVTEEVEGYLAGTWDQHSGELVISQAYPLRVNEGKENSDQMSTIKKSMREKNLILVGWYHSHPKTVPQPSVGDIKKQLKYQKQMLKTAKQPYYSPCVGLIASPFGSRTSKLAAIFQMYWIMPVFAQCGRDFGRPMQVAYVSPRDAFLTQDLLVEMVSL